MPARGYWTKGGDSEVLRHGQKTSAFSKAPFCAPKTKRQGLWSLKAPSFRRKKKKTFSINSSSKARGSRGLVSDEDPCPDLGAEHQDLGMGPG